MVPDYGLVDALESLEIPYLAGLAALNEAAESYLAETGFDPTFGARPIKRLIQHEIQDVIAYKMLDESLQPGDKIEVRRGKNGLTFHRAG